MKNVKTKLVSLILALTAAFTMTACGGGGDDSKTPGESKNPTESTGASESINAEKLQLYVVNYNGGYGSSWLNEVKEEYEALHKDTKYGDKTGIQIVVKTDRPSMEASVIKSGESEIYFVEHVPYIPFVSDDVMADITDVVTGVNPYDGKTLESKLSAQQKNAWKTADSAYYALPHYSGTYGIIYDIDLFESKNLYFRAKENVPANAALKDYFIAKKGDKKSDGPDGKPDTYDDGLPATYEEFFLLCDRMLDFNLIPVDWSGQYKDQHVTSFLSSLAADYEGLGQALLNLSFDGEATGLGKIVNGQFVKDATATAIDGSKGYELFRQEGVYQSLKFLAQLFGNDKYYNKAYAFSASDSQLDAQDRYLTSADDGKRIAMLIDGDWWSMEADETIRANEYDDRKFGWMPLPKADETKVKEQNKNIIYDRHSAMTFIKSTIATEKLAAAKDFLQFVNSDKMLVKFTQETNAFKGFNYTLTDDELETLSAFGQSLYKVRQNSDVIYLASANKVYANNQSMFQLDALYKSMKAGTTANYDYPLTAVKEAIDAKKAFSAETYFSGVYEYFKANWPKN